MSEPLRHKPVRECYLLAALILDFYTLAWECKVPGVPLTDDCVNQIRQATLNKSSILLD